MAKYEAVIRYDEDFNLNTVLKNGGEVVSAKLIASHTVVDLTPVKQLQSNLRNSEAFPAKPAKKKAFPIKGIDLLRQIFSDGAIHDTFLIREHFIRKGFSGNGSSPRINDLLGLGEIRRVAEHKYQATPKLLRHKGDGK
jgi:hypothetical protein